MIVNEVLIAALTPLGYDIAADASDEQDDYITFNYSDERPVMYADDTDVLDYTAVQVHFFSTGEVQLVKKRIRRQLREAGFTILRTAEMYEDDTKKNHIVVEAAILGDVDDEETGGS